MDLSLHHEFSKSISETDQAAVKRMIEYIKDYGNPFYVSETSVKNFVTGEQLEEGITTHHLNCLEIGEKKYN